MFCNNNCKESSIDSSSNQTASLSALRSLRVAAASASTSTSTPASRT